MRVISASFVAAFLLAAPNLAHAQAATSHITCSQIPDAQRFLDGLKPGPNTSAARQHLDAAKQAADGGNDRQCVSELSRVNYYATRSAAADKRAATHPATRRHVLCADALHQNRPGGSDYHGPAVAGCPRRTL
ncbi:MAG TPA: hypothetical protein VGF92_10870 [Stellaceae bacterium]|jgi:hypothetical protein